MNSVDTAFATLRAELAEVSLTIATARDDLLATPEPIAKLDAEDAELETAGKGPR